MSKNYLEILPERCLEVILDKLSLQDFDNATKSCLRLNEVGKTVRKSRNIRLQKVLLQNGVAKWELLHNGNSNGISPGCRFGATLVYYNNSVYLFGGATVNWTSFNDLWRFDFISNKWNRVIVKGSVPNPRACCTGLVYGDSFILIGGFELAYSLHAKRHTIWDNAAYIYNFNDNTWTKLVVDNAEIIHRGYASGLMTMEPPGSTWQLSPSPVGQSYSLLLDHFIIMFGGAESLLHHSEGYNRQIPAQPHCLSNKCYLLDLRTFVMSEILVNSDTKPPKRCGHNTMSLGRNQLLVLGGWLGPNTRDCQDLWLLTHHFNTTNQWEWTQLKIDDNLLQPPSEFYGYGSSSLIITNMGEILVEAADKFESSDSTDAVDTDSGAAEEAAMGLDTSWQSVLFVLGSANKRVESLLAHQQRSDVDKLTFQKSKKLIVHSLLIRNGRVICDGWLSPSSVSQDLINAPTVRQGFSITTASDAGRLFVYGGLKYDGMNTRPVHLLMDLMKRDSNNSQSLDGARPLVHAYADLYQLSYNNCNNSILL